MPSEVCESYSNSLFPESHSCCSAERAHEEFVKVNPYDRWGRFMGFCVTHLLPFHPPLRPDAPLFTLRCPPPTQRKKKNIWRWLFIQPPFSTSSHCLLEMTEIVRWMTHDTQVFSDTRCCQQAFVPMEKKTKKHHELISSSESCETRVSIQAWTTFLMFKRSSSHLMWQLLFRCQWIIQRRRHSEHQIVYIYIRSAHTDIKSVTQYYMSASDLYIKT